jgi:murein DD-endopeptidase MepM/ murein hydrolase activator NlpD
MTWIGQSYAQVGVRQKGRFHTGLDMGGWWGNEVRAAAAGTLVKIQQNGAGEDHGYGNTVVLRHDEALFGQTLFTQYSHLDSIEPALVSACGPVDARRRNRRTCRRTVRVSAAQRLGWIGASGNGNPRYWGQTPHLHFEVKSFGMLAPRGDDASGYDYGYLSVHPDVATAGGARYFNPFLRLHSVEAQTEPRPLRSTRATDVLIGPGGRAAEAYRAPASLPAGESLDGWVYAPATSTPYCSGWYLARRRSGARFADMQYGGELPEGWICRDALVAPTPTPAPVSPVLLIDGGTSRSRPQGQTFLFSASGLTPNGGTTRWLAQPNGSVVQLQPKLWAGSTGQLAWSYAPVCTTPTGTYLVTIVDDATRRQSAWVQEVVTRGSQCP